MDLVYAFDTKTNSWNIPKTMGANIVKKSMVKGIVDYNQKMYLFGGHDGINHLNDMLILNTINLIWEKGSLVNVPTPRDEYGATLLPNQHIIYLGKRSEERRVGKE